MSLTNAEAQAIRERTKAGLAVARARGRNGGRKIAIISLYLERKVIVNTFEKGLQQHLKPATAPGATQTASTPKPQDDPERKAWRKSLAEKMIEASKRMETDPEFRKRIQAMTH